MKMQLLSKSIKGKEKKINQLFLYFQMPNVPCNDNGQYLSPLSSAQTVSTTNSPPAHPQINANYNTSARNKPNLVPDSSRTKHNSHKVEAKRTVEVYPT